MLAPGPLLDEGPKNIGPVMLGEKPLLDVPVEEPAKAP
jgi:hypothetical protein